ncbi:MAG: VWA domain-containing protein, partial [Spirochaetales bacterium]|nr:VWA domain-containing protein [Spirochaetales bacterium]
IISAQNITITQLDSTELLISSRIDCYLSITDDQGEPLEDVKTDLIRMEHETEEGMNTVEILDIQRNNLAEEDITFLLVLDNSGSMYEPVGDGMAGNRMDHAKRAVKEFLGSLDEQNTRVGLAVFNTKYILLVEPDKNIKAIEEALEGIDKPDNKNAYTELYYSISQAARDMARYRGRKAIVLLSDGENYPYFTMSGNLHPDLGETLYLPDNGLEPLKREGVTLYGINFSTEKDKSLASISIESGGTMYEAVTDEELSGVYDRIKNRIEKEYRVTVRAPLVFIGSPEMSAEYAGSGDTVNYYARTLMGNPERDYLFLSLMILLLSFVIWVILMLIRFEKPANQAELSMLPSGAGKPAQRTIALTSQMTVIGGSAQADFTVAGIPSLKESHATIVQDEKA